MIATLVPIALLVSSASAACFYPDGSVAQDTPCTDSTNESACCGTGYACLGQSSSFFLCQATGSEFQKAGASQFVRGSCTDKSWRSSNCPNVCVDPKRDNTGGGHGVAQCPRSDVLFYCISTGLGVENCSTGFNLINFASKPSLLTTIGVSPSSTSASTSSSATSSTSLTGSPTGASTSSPALAGNTGLAATDGSSSSSNNGTTIGVAVGVTVGGLGLIAGAVATWFLVRKKRRSAAGAVPTAMTAVQDPGRDFSAVYEPYKRPAYQPVLIEAPANEHSERYELPSEMHSRPPNS